MIRGEGDGLLERTGVHCLRFFLLSFSEVTCIVALSLIMQAEEEAAAARRREKKIRASHTGSLRSPTRAISPTLPWIVMKTPSCSRLACIASERGRKRWAGSSRSWSITPLTRHHNADGCIYYHQWLPLAVLTSPLSELLAVL